MFKYSILISVCTSITLNAVQVPFTTELLLRHAAVQSVTSLVRILQSCLLLILKNVKVHNKVHNHSERCAGWRISLGLWSWFVFYKALLKFPQ